MLATAQGLPLQKSSAETVDVTGDDVAVDIGQAEIFDLSDGSDADCDGGSDCDDEASPGRL